MKTATASSKKQSNSKTNTDSKSRPQTPLGLDDEDFSVEDNDDGTKGLLTRKRTRQPEESSRRGDWLRPYWLGFGLFLILYAFWMLDSMKDPVFAILVDGNLDQHQPPAKLFSVFCTLGLVCFLEFLSHATKQRKKEECRRSDEEVMDGGGRWTRMSLEMEPGECSVVNDRVPVAIFAYIGFSYVFMFSLLAYLMQYHPSFSNNGDEPTSSTAWHVLGYFLYATIESFGSLAVATFWSYANSTLSLEDAEHYYGLTIAIAQLGAIGGSTMLTTHYWPTTTLMLVANLVISLQVLVMMAYARRFPPTVKRDMPTPECIGGTSDKPVLWSGVYLILKHNYVLMILGVSCLYEVSLTCLDYQMKLLGWNRFEVLSLSPNMSFAQFMGRYGQLTNITSLVFSSLVFPYLIQTYGLKLTLRIFPTLLLFATVLAYGALPGNLAVLFVSMSILKGMTYSIHDPTKELLYAPTSDAIKYRAKFWIDVVGARVSKAIGSSINTYAGSVDRSVRVGTVPSLLTAGALWYVCYLAGLEFDRLIKHDIIVGHEDAGDHVGSGKLDYSKLSTVEEENDDRLN